MKKLFLMMLLLSLSLTFVACDKNEVQEENIEIVEGDEIDKSVQETMFCTKCNKETIHYVTTSNTKKVYQCSRCYKVTEIDK